MMRRTSDLLCRIPTRSIGLTLLRDKTIFQIVFRTPTSSTDITFSRFFATGIAHRVLCWAIADKMTRLCARRKFPGFCRKQGDVYSVANSANVSFRWFRAFGAVGDEVLTGGGQHRRPEEEYGWGLTSVPSQRLHLYPGGGFPGSPKPLH